MLRTYRIPRGSCSFGSGLRWQSTDRLKELPIYLVAVPLSSSKTYLYCKHTKKALPGGKEPIDTKLVNWAAKAWKKMEDSNNKVNVTIVDFVKRMLDKIPWDEGSLRSIPSKNSILRELKDSAAIEKIGDTRISPSQVDIHALSSDELQKIPLFYPKGLVAEGQLFEQMKKSVLLGEQHHKKYMVYSLMVLPFTLPVALLPVVPNVPGFYVAYRAWCHFTAFRGASYLKYLLGLPPSQSGVHLDFIGVDGVADLYLGTSDAAAKKTVQKTLEHQRESEELFLSEDAIAAITEKFGIPEVGAALTTALHQETGKKEKANTTK